MTSSHGVSSPPNLDLQRKRAPKSVRFLFVQGGARIGAGEQWRAESPAQILDISFAQKGLCERPNSNVNHKREPGAATDQLNFKLTR